MAGSSQVVRTLLQRAALLSAEPWLLLGVSVLAYGLWVPWLGLFGDDWSYVWYYHLLGPLGPGEFAAIDRPLSGWFYTLSMVILGELAWPYHVFIITLRWLSAVLFGWVLRLVWPDRAREALLAALLLAVYPGFLQTPISVQFILHFAILDLFLLSLGASLLSAARPQKFWQWTGVAVAGAAGVFALEYFAGLEALRPLLLWFAVSRMGLRGRQRWWTVLKSWLPAVLVMVAFLFWRVWVFQFPTYEPVLLEQLADSPLQGLKTLVRGIANGMNVALLGAWRQVLTIPPAGLRLPYGLVAGLSFLVLAWFFWQQRQAQDTTGPGARRWGVMALGIGLLSMLTGGAPFWVTGIPITLEFPWDRPTLSLMLGSSLVLAGLVSLVGWGRFRSLLPAALVSLAIGMHFLNGNIYLREWEKMQSFLWQLTWRAPALKPGTLVLFDWIPLNRYSDNDLTAPLNWTYAPEHRSAVIPYKFFDLTLRLDEEHAGLPGVEKGLVVEHEQRGTFFRSTTSETLALHYAPPACLKIVGPEDANWPGLPDRIQRVLPMTDLSQITTATQAVPPRVTGAEPAHTWCYFFQKADLARQQRDWAAVVDWARQAQAAGLSPAAPEEWLPIIEGYAQQGDWAQAMDRATEAAQSEAVRPALCDLWRRVAAQAAQAGVAPGVFEEIGCTTDL